MKDRRKLCKFDFDGMCKPRGNHNSNVGQESFSVSIFQWVENRAGGLKKSKSVYRVKGWVRDPEKVYKRAGEICDLLDEGKSLRVVVGERKSETVP